MKRASARHLLVAGAAIVALAGLPGPASAAWSTGAPSAGPALSLARVLPAGTRPTAAAAGRTVTVSWSAPDDAAAAPPAGYEVRRTTSGSDAAAAGTCAGTVTALSCRDQAPPGTHAYAVRPVREGWRGAWGEASDPVTVAPPALSLSPATLDALPGSTSASLSGFAADEAVTFRLDGPGGPLLTSDPASVTAGADGTAGAALTIPAGTAVGPHTVHAIGAAGSQATAGLDHWPPPALVLAATSFTTLPATTTATVSGMAAAQQVTFRLDSTTGPVLTTAPASVVTDASGAATASVTVPAGTANGTHTIHAVPAAGPAASAGVAVSATPASPTALTIVNVTGRSRYPDADDRIQVTFSAELRPSSLCSAWPSTSAAGSAAGSVRLFTPTGGSNTVDVVAMTGCSDFAAGAIDLGRTDFTTTVGTVALWPASTIAWDPATRQLTLTLGGTVQVTGGGALARVGNGNPRASTYTPDAAMLALGGVPVTGTFTSAPFVPF